MSIKLRVAGSWLDVSAIKLRVADTWKDVTGAYLKDSTGSWKSLFSGGSTPRIQTRVTLSVSNTTFSSTNPPVLTGTFYHWTNADSFSYNFQSSADGSTWSDCTATMFFHPNASNPSYGASATVTAEIRNTDLQATTTYFRFVVTGINSTVSPSKTKTSISDNVSINTYPPNTPTGLQQSSLYTGYTNIGMIWNLQSDADSFDYYVSTTNVLPPGVSPTGSVAGGPNTAGLLNYTVMGSTTPTTYYFWVRAVNTAGVSSWTSSVSGIADAQAFATPEPPTGFSVSSTYPYFILSWNNVSGLTYDVFWSVGDAPENSANPGDGTFYGVTSPYTYPISFSAGYVGSFYVRAVKETFRSTWTGPQSATMSSPPIPVQNSKPSTPSGSGQYGTSVSKGSAGTYSNASSITTTLEYIIGSNTPSSGTESSSSNTLSSPHTVDQPDFTHQSNRFYTVDTVVGTNGKTYYYYSDSSVTAYINSISDNFNRANSNGLNQTSSGLYYTASLSNYASQWYVTSNAAWSSQSVSSDSPSNPLGAVEAGGRGTVNASLSYIGGGGYGIAFWVTAANSWWAASTYYAIESSSGTQCLGTGGTNTTGCPSVGTSVGNACNCTSNVVSAYTCDVYAGSDTVCPSFGNNPGDYCRCDSTSTSYYACTGSSQGPVSSCTNSNNQTSGGVCNCTASTSTSYACNSAGGSNYTGWPAAGDGPGDACNRTSVTVAATPSTCSVPYSGASSCVQNGQNEGQGCGTCTPSSSSTTTYGCTGSVSGRSACGGTAGGVYNASTVGVRCGTCNGSYPNYSYSVVAATTTTTTTYSGNTRSPSDPGYTTYSWDTRSSSGTSTTTYTYNTRSNSLTVVSGYDLYKRANTQTNTTNYSWNTIISTAGSYYNTYLKVNQSNGSSVINQGSLNIASSSTSFQNAGSISLQTSGNSIAVSAMGSTLNVTGSAPSNYSSKIGVGVIKMKTPSNEASYIDNFSASIS